MHDFWSTVAIRTFLLNPWDFQFVATNHLWEHGSWEHGAADEHSVEGEEGTVILQESSWSFNDFWDWLWDNMWSFFSFALWFILWAIITISLFKAIKYFLVLMYDVFNAKRIEYFKVIQPRWDSKLDREVQRELAKDMKEKISRMAQVYANVHKLWELSVVDGILRRLFKKPKITFLLHYEKWKIEFIIGTYPEYRKIVESAIAAQYSDSSLQTIEKPHFFSHQYSDLMPLQPIKEWVYPIRMFRQMEDDPINNIIDSMAKIPQSDTFTMMLTVRPERWAFNQRAQKFADALYRKDDSVTKWTRFFQYLLPWNLLKFLTRWPSEELVQRFTGDKTRWDPMIRMVKAEEEALNNMAEEAGKKAFYSWLMLLSSSPQPKKARENIYNLVSAFTVYSDEYNNALDQPEVLSDIFGVIVKPLWRASITFLIPWFFYKKNVFSVSELASLFHLPDGMYNRSPAISWMDYKMLAPPDNLPLLKEENPDFFMTWIIAESYKWWNISKILSDKIHPAVWIKEEIHEEKIPVDASYVLQEWEELREEDDSLYVIRKTTTKKAALKIYNDWILLWLNVYRNKFSPVYMKQKDRTRHHYIIWKSGTWKSVFIAALARQDIWANAWVCVVDPHGDLVEGILEYVPKHRAKDVIYFDAGNAERPMWLNLYQVKSFNEADRVVNDAVEIFIKMFGPEIFGPRIQEYFKYGSLTLLEDMEDRATLIDVPRLFTDEWYREYKIAKVKNPVVRNFWDKTYNAMGDREKQEIIPYFTSKFVSFTTNWLIRNIIGQTESAFNFRDVMDNWKILLINLSKGMIWELNAQLLWMIIVSKVYNAAMGRADMAEKDRRFFYLYVDEFQNFVTDTFADILSEARKYKLCLIMAHQYIAQLDWSAWNNIWEWKSKVKDAVFGNVWTMQSFKVGAPDAEFLEKEYAPVLSAQDILWIANYKAYIKLNINNTTSRVFSLNALWTQDYKNERVAEILKQYSEKKYGRKREFVDAEIAARLWILGDNHEIPWVDDLQLESDTAWDTESESDWDENQSE